MLACNRHPAEMLFWSNNVRQISHFNTFAEKRGEHGKDQVWAAITVLIIIEQLQLSWWQKLRLTFSSPLLA